MKAARRPEFLDGPFVEASAPRLPMDEWVARNRVVVDGAHAGRWSTAYGFMAVEPMRAFSDLRTREVVIIAPTQLMKTEYAINAALYTVWYGDDCMLLEPDLELLKEMMADRVRPALSALGRSTTSGAMPAGERSAILRIELRLGGAGSIKGATPGMKTGLSARSVRVVIIDEADKMGRADVMIHAKSRTTTFMGDARIVAVTSPTVSAAGKGWRLWEEGSRGEWRGTCPRCRDLVSLDWERVDFRRDDDGYWVVRWGPGDDEVAALVCESCGSRWTEAERLAAVRAGGYVHEVPEHSRRSYRVPGPAHLWRTVEDIAALGASSYRALRDDHDPAEHIAWTNDFAGRLWRDDYEGLSATALERATYLPGPRGESDFGELDPGAVVITAGADVGAGSIHVEWVAWGVDAETERVRSWGLRYLVIGGDPADSIDEPDLWERFDEEIRRSAWRRPGAGRVVAARVFVDSGHRPEIVTTWCGQRYAAERPKTPEPFGAQVLPVRGHHTEHGHYPGQPGRGHAAAKGPAYARARDRVPRDPASQTDAVRLVGRGPRARGRAAESAPDPRSRPRSTGTTRIGSRRYPRRSSARTARRRAGP